MTSPSPSPTSWVRRRGPIVAVTLLIVVAAAIVIRRGSGPLSATRSAAAISPLGEPDAWMNRWHQETFDGQDSRKLWAQFSRAARGELSKPGADPSDLAAKANAIGADPEKIYEFIRDQITLEPYAGVLRGARGTLAARAGNALDRALLAKDLLRLNNIDSRLVSGRLSDAQTDTLLARFFSGSQVPTVLAPLIARPNEAVTKEQSARFDATFRLPEKASADLADHMLDQAKEFWTKTDAQSSAQFDSLDSQLRRAGMKMAVDARALTAKLKETLREHYWLQVREPDGAWRDFDAAFADPKRGTAHCSTAVVLSDAPDSLYHKLVFTLIYESMTDGAPREDTVVSGSYASADAMFQSIEFHIQPTDLGQDASALIAMDDKTKIETLRNMKRFQGLLFAGGQVTAGRKFDFEGNTYDPTSGPASLKPAGTFADALGGAESAVQFVELRVVMRLTGPGREPMIQSRTLVTGLDLGSPTFAPPILEWEILLQPQWIPDEFVAFRALNRVLAMGDALVKISEGDRSLPSSRDPSSASPLALQMALLRQTAVAKILATRNGVRAFIDEPMLTIAGHQLARIDEHEGQITASRSFDIVENGIRYVPSVDTAAAAAFDAALRQGVADCTLEDRILRENFPRQATRSGMTIIEQAKLEKRPVLLAKTQDIDALRSTGVTEADINWIHDNESADSRLVVATTASGSDAWWSVRPNGTAILRTNGGGGQSTLEYLTLVADAELIFLCSVEVGEAIGEKIFRGHVGDHALFKAVSCVFITGMGRFSFFVMGGHPHFLEEALWLSIDLFFHNFLDAEWHH
jgi:hypothetical protein